MQQPGDESLNFLVRFTIGSVDFEIVCANLLGRTTFIGYRNGEPVAAAKSRPTCLNRLVDLEQRYRLLLTRSVATSRPH